MTPAISPLSDDRDKAVKIFLGRNLSSRAREMLPEAVIVEVNGTDSAEWFIVLREDKKMRMICPDCRGKGHVMDGAAIALFFFPVSLLLAACEGHDRRGITRQKCPKCKGAGFIHDSSCQSTR